MVEVSARADGKRVSLLFAISDTGIGSRPDKVSGSSALSHKAIIPRVGNMGAPVRTSDIRRLVELMGGRIWVNSPSDLGLRMADPEIRSTRPLLICDPKTAIPDR